MTYQPRFDRVAHMNAGRDASKRLRDEGGSTVRVYNTTTAMLHALGRVEGDNFDRWLAEVRDRVSEICEHSRFVIYGEQWEGL